MGESLKIWQKQNRRLIKKQKPPESMQRRPSSSGHSLLSLLLFFYLSLGLSLSLSLSSFGFCIRTRILSRVFVKKWTGLLFLEKWTKLPNENENTMGDVLLFYHFFKFFTFLFDFWLGWKWKYIVCHFFKFFTFLFDFWLGWKRKYHGQCTFCLPLFKIFYFLIWLLIEKGNDINCQCETTRFTKMKKNPCTDVHGTRDSFFFFFFQFLNFYMYWQIDNIINRLIEYELKNDIDKIMCKSISIRLFKIHKKLK